MQEHVFALSPQKKQNICALIYSPIILLLSFHYFYFSISVFNKYFFYFSIITQFEVLSLLVSRLKYIFMHFRDSIILMMYSILYLYYPCELLFLH